jgi:zinc protease
MMNDTEATPARLRRFAAGSLCGRLLAVASVAACLGGTARAQTGNWPSERPPQPLPSRDIKFPPYEVRTLPNGLQVVAVLHHEQPAVSMRLLVRAGSASDPNEKLGMAHLVSSLLDQGTTTKSAQEMNDAIDFIGGEMGAGAGTDLSFITTVVMKDSFMTGLNMLSDMTRHPLFAQAEIERQRQQMLSGLQVSFENPEWVANGVFQRLVYGLHPYGLPESGTVESIAGITRNDLLAFHQKYFAPNNALLAIVGDVTAAEAFSAATAVFGDWQRREVRQEPFMQPPSPARRVVVVNKPDAVQTEIRVGHLGIPRKHDDYMALNLAIRILGGEGSNRLHQVLRTDRALTYGAQANMNTLKESGDFEAETNTRSAATAEALKLMVDEFWRLQREPVDERELAGAKAYITGNFPLTIETPGAIATQVLHALFYGLPLQELETFRARVNAVTTDDIHRVAQVYLKPDRLSIVLVGDASAFASQLKGIGFGEFETVEISALDLTAANFKHGSSRTGRVGRAGLPRERAPIVRFASTRQDERRGSSLVPEEGAKAKDLLDRVIAAKGGLALLRGIKSIKAVTSASMTTPRGPVEAETTTYLEYPDHVRVETKLPQGTQVQVYDGEHAWVRDPRGVFDVPPRAVADMVVSLKRDTVAALIAADRGDLRARLLPDVKDEHGKLHHALEVSSPSLDPLVFYVDPQTHLIAKQTYVAGVPGQPLVEELFSDYRSISGLEVAFTAEVRRDGHSIVQRRVTEFTMNPPIDAALFKRPAS